MNYVKGWLMFGCCVTEALCMRPAENQMNWQSAAARKHLSAASFQSACVIFAGGSRPNVSLQIRSLSKYAKKKTPGRTM